MGAVELPTLSPFMSMLSLKDIMGCITVAASGLFIGNGGLIGLTLADTLIPQGSWMQLKAARKFCQQSWKQWRTC